MLTWLLSLLAYCLAAIFAAWRVRKAGSFPCLMVYLIVEGARLAVLFALGDFHSPAFVTVSQFFGASMVIFRGVVLIEMFLKLAAGCQEECLLLAAIIMSSATAMCTFLPMTGQAALWTFRSCAHLTMAVSSLEAWVYFGFIHKPSGERAVATWDSAGFLTAYLVTFAIEAFFPNPKTGTLWAQMNLALNGMRAAFLLLWASELRPISAVRDARVLHFPRRAA